MNKQIVTFVDYETEKHKFHQHKNSISIYDVDIKKILVSNKVSLGKKVLNILLVTKMVKKLTIMRNASKNDRT